MVDNGNSAMDVQASDQLPAKTVVAIDAADFAGVRDQSSADVSGDATVVERDDPLPVSTGASGASAVTDSPHASLWQHDLFAVRVLEDISWQMRRAGRVAVVSGTKW